MDWSELKFVAGFRRFGDACDIGDEVDRFYGTGATCIALGGRSHRIEATLYIHEDRPRANDAYDYAIALVDASVKGIDDFHRVIREKEESVYASK